MKGRNGRGIIEVVEGKTSQWVVMITATIHCLVMMNHAGDCVIEQTSLETGYREGGREEGIVRYKDEGQRGGGKEEKKQRKRGMERRKEGKKQRKRNLLLSCQSLPGADGDHLILCSFSPLVSRFVTNNVSFQHPTTTRKYSECWRDNNNLAYILLSQPSNT